MQKLIELYGKADKETIDLLTRFAGKALSMANMNDYIKSVLRNELDNVITVTEQPVGK